ncbi:hypothetical protein MTO96_036814, partial [Rhipicephalus appendiculatus]
MALSSVSSARQLLMKKVCRHLIFIFNEDEETERTNEPSAPLSYSLKHFTQHYWEE